MKTKPELIKCMNCKYYNGLHEILSKVKCGFQPTSDDMRHRSIDNKLVDCPVYLWDLNWKDYQKH
jgi:hypothetical protein